METVKLHPSVCAICQSDGNATELYPANFGIDAFDPAVFSARRLPDRIHYRIVRCNKCGLVRSDPVADSHVMAQLYQHSTFDYGEEVDNLQATYGRYLSMLSDYSTRHGRILDIGCGNGFVLEEAIRRGYTEVSGVEPSSAAVEAAAVGIRPHIICDIMRPGLFPPDQFDVICLFQTFDHIPEPGKLLDECLNILRPGGLLLCLNHDVEAWSARILRNRSPIIDIEHTYLFSQKTMTKILSDHGFSVKRTGSVSNVYSPRYLWQLLPVPQNIKRPVLGILQGALVHRIRISVPLGNLFAIAQRPE